MRVATRADARLCFRHDDGKAAGKVMTYFVTGATGFIGRHLLQNLLRRKGTIWCLVRKESLGKFKALRDTLGADADRLVAVASDLRKPELGISAQVLRDLSGKVR